MHPGPYLCLCPGCEFTVPEAPDSTFTSKILLDHWVDQQPYHGPVEDMLYLDQSSNTVLNVKGMYCNTARVVDPDSKREKM